MQGCIYILLVLLLAPIADAKVFYDKASIENLELPHQVTGDTPSSGRLNFYSKSDNKLYTKDSSGNEAEVGSASGTPDLVTDKTVRRDENGDFVANEITADLVGDVTGNADTASALAANPTDCAPGEFSLGIDADGAAVCDTMPDFDDLAPTASKGETIFHGASGNEAFGPCPDGQIAIYATSESAGVGCGYPGATDSALLPYSYASDGDWPEGVPSDTEDALNKLAAREGGSGGSPSVLRMTDYSLSSNFGSTDTRVFELSGSAVTHESIGSGITYANNSTNGMTLTVASASATECSISAWVTRDNTTNLPANVTKNADLTTRTTSIEGGGTTPAPYIIALNQIATTGSIGTTATLSWSGNCELGDVFRIQGHTSFSYDSIGFTFKVR